MNVTFAHFTSRLEPCWDWFCDSLCNQLSPEELATIQVIFVDRHLWHRAIDFNGREREKMIRLGDEFFHDAGRRDKLAACVKDRFEFLHLPVKPNVWQGPFRLTARDWFAAAQARNTAFMAARHGYFVGVDDLSVLLPGWGNQVRHAASSGYCVCGAYKKVKDLVVKDGYVESFTEFPPGVDSRWSRGSDTGITPWSGAGLFGCSFGVPLDLVLKVNGMDEITDGQSAEDYDFGIRLERAGGKFYYNRNMVTYESEERHHLDDPLPRTSKLVLPQNLPEGYTGNPMSDHVLLNRVRNEDRIESLRSSLRHDRSIFLSTRTVEIPSGPELDWRDNEPLDIGRPKYL